MLAISLSELGELFAPIGFLWVCLLVVAGWKAHRRQWRDAGGSFGLALLVWIIGGTPLPDALLASLERPYAGLKLEGLGKADAVVLLGGSSWPSRYEAGQMHLNRAADRTLMALHLIQNRKGDVLVIGGGKKRDGDQIVVMSENTRDWFRQGNFFTNEVIALPPCVNTRDEAAATRDLATERNWRRVFLVTSASHMRRAAGVFRSHGVEIVEIPCAFQTDVSLLGTDTWFVIPRVGKFVMLTDYLHEIIGWRYYRLRGWINAEAAQKTPSLNR